MSIVNVRTTMQLQIERIIVYDEITNNIFSIKNLFILEKFRFSTESFDSFNPNTPNLFSHLQYSSC